MIANLHIYVDGNDSTAFEPVSDRLVATVASIQLTGGRMLVPVAASTDTQLAPGVTKGYFVVLEIAPGAAAQIPNTIRITHIRQGSERSVVRDVVSGAVLTVEPAANPDQASGLTVVRQILSFGDWSAAHFGGSGGAGSQPLQSYSQDGLANILKYAFATNPIVNAGLAGFPQLLGENGIRVLRHLRPATVVDLNYQYEISNDLVNWRPALPVIDYSQSDTPFGDGTVRRDLRLTANSSQTFLRVRVSLAN